MNIVERINKIKEYFVQFDVTEKTAYVLVKFPEANVSEVKYKWNLPDSKEMTDKYNLYIKSNNNGVYFVGTLETVDDIFDAIDYVIEFNRDQEERIKLFNIKINELKELFGSEDISTLRNLVFKENEKPFTPPKVKALKKVDKKKEEKVEMPTPVVEENKVINKNNDIVEEESSMMSVVKSIAEE